MSTLTNPLSEPRWIGYDFGNTDEYVYWEDSSYVEVTSRTYPGMVSWQGYVNGYEQDHSAITTIHPDSVISKWRDMPLAKHKIEDSPYGGIGLKYYIKMPSISGPSTICSEETYTINYLPEGATVQWSVRNNLSILSGQGTDNIVVQKNTDGLSTITAVMSLNNQEIATIRKNVQTGSDFPVFALYDASTHAQVQIGTTGELHYFSATGNNLPSEPGNFHWTLITPNPNDIPYNFSGPQFSFTAFEEGYYAVILKINGECGWSEENQAVYYFQNNGGFILFPNPASKSVTVDVSEMTNKTTSSLLKAQNENYTIQLWNSFGLVRQVTADMTSYQLDLTGVPPGFYYVHVIKDGLTYRRQLIIK